jgi:hypothetical protein
LALLNEEEKPPKLLGKKEGRRRKVHRVPDVKYRILQWST